MTRSRLAAALLLTTLGLLATPTPAAAHPLGNFTTNQYAGLRVTADGVDIDYVLDLAELPAYQARQDIDTDRNGTTDQAERDRYAAGTCTAAGSATVITVDGSARAVTARPVALTFPAGSGGLETLRLQCLLHADARPADGTSVGLQANYLSDRIGWREVTAVGDRYTLTNSTVPATSSSARLTAYPPGSATSDIRSATLTVRPGGPAAAAFPGEQPTAADQSRGADRLTAWFTEVVGHPRLTWTVGILAVLIAVVLGGAHAVAPGHGKTIMAAYLVGAQGRISHALTMAVTVAVTHTAGVLALGVVLATSLQLAPQDLYEWLRLASGILVAAVGAHLLRHALRSLRAHRAAHAHAHAHGHTHAYEHPPAEHEHPHTHSHGGGRPHTHALPEAGQPFRVRSLLAMGFAGGLSPSPSAVVVLLGAAALGRAWYGVLLVLAYGVGLAAVLTGIGLALARWGERLHAVRDGRLVNLLTRWMPAATAGAILTIGIGMATFSVTGLLAVAG